MRKLLLGLVGASALAMGTAANATLIVSTSTQVSAFTGPNTPDSGVHYTFSYTSTCGSTGAPPAGPVTCAPSPPLNPFEATVSFLNDASGFYGLGIQTTATTLGDDVIDLDTDVDFTNAWIETSTGTFIQALTNQTGANDVHESWALSGWFLDAGSYVIRIQGNRGDASSFDGNLNYVFAAREVPEPATWAMMLLGFGVVGLQLRRRRRPVLLQAA